MNLLYNPDFVEKLEINGDWYCRADSLLAPEPGLKYFRQISLAAFKNSFWGRLVWKMIKLEHEALVEVPFIASVSYINDWSAYIGWPHPRFLRDDIEDIEYYRNHWKPEVVARLGDKIDQEFAEELFPFLKELRYRT